MSVTERKTTVFCGTYRDDTAIPYVIPEGNLFRRDFMIPSEHTQNANNNDKVVVELLQWENAYVNPEARITRVLGPPDTPRVDLEMVARSFGVEIDFPDAVVKETSNFPTGLSPKEIGGFFYTQSGSSL